MNEEEEESLLAPRDEKARRRSQKGHLVLPERKEGKKERKTRLSDSRR